MLFGARVISDFSIDAIAFVVLLILGLLMHVLASLHNLYPRFWPFASTLHLSLGAEVAFFSRFLPFVFVLVCPRVADSAAFLQPGRHCLCHGALRSQHLSRVCFPNSMRRCCYSRKADF
ncbi:hypothetical protein IWX47DRAFT_873471 [Phyllosticta citricarpa]